MRLQKHESNILVPNSKEAMDEITRTNDEGGYIVLSIDRNYMASLLYGGLGNHLDNGMELNLDVWEEEEVIGEQDLKALRQLLENYIEINNLHPADHAFIGIVINMVDLALSRGSGVFFWL